MTLRSLFTEFGVLGMFGFGLAVSRACHRSWSPAVTSLMCVVGLLFELLTARFWNYHHIVFRLPNPCDADISALFPLAWAGLLMASTSLSETLARRMRLRSRLSRHAMLMAAWFVIGNLFETIFFNIGVIEYARGEHERILFMLGQAPYLPPFAVMLGYGVFPPLVSRLFMAINRPAPRPRASPVVR